MYIETSIFIPVHIKEEAIESLAQKRLGSSGPVGTTWMIYEIWGGQY